MTRRVTVPPSVLRQPTAFSPYTVGEYQRQDTVSYLYYGQDDDDWMISLANQIVDPYHGWFLDQDELVTFVAQKYGSLPEAMSRVAYWLCNWTGNDQQITKAYYDALTENLKKYWIPVFGQASDILGYQRREEDWTTSTNMLMDVHPASAVSLQEGELVTVSDPAGNFQGTGELVWVSDDTLRVKDVQGDWEVGYTVSTASGSGTIASMELPVMMIPIDELVYFSPVTCWDVEYDKNEQNKEVLLIQDGFRGVMYSELTASLNGPV